jgi:ankyrin repeat protein
MKASRNGHLDIVRTLLEAKADVNAKDQVRNQMMMMMMMMMMMIVVINDEDRDVCR